MQEQVKDIEIARIGHPVLKQVAKTVDDIQSSAVQEVVDDMILAHRQSGGVGIAAPQIFIPLRIIIFQVTAACSAAKGVPETPLTILINPVVKVLDDTPLLEWEGCLSVPGMYGEVKRPSKICYSGFDRAGKMIDGELDGYAARIVMHELDHLDGALYPMRLHDMSRFGCQEEVREFLFD